MNNAVYGKTMENVRKRVNIKLMTDAEKVNKLYKKPNFKKDTHFDDNLIAVHMEMTTVKLDKPIYLGVSILELSKTLMYRFHYDYIKPKYGEKAKLLFTDTDNLCYEIETEDFYEDISEDVNKWFDTSNYDEDHPLYTKKNKKEVGFMKDKCGGKYIKKFVGLRSKLYAYKMHRVLPSIATGQRNSLCAVGPKEEVEGEEKKKCKGVKTSVVENNITVGDYEKCLNSKQPLLKTMNTFRSRLHNIGTERINKTALSANDDKRIILEDGITTLAYGYRGEKWAKELKEVIEATNVKTNGIAQ
jgi:hypothetical protein